MKRIQHNYIKTDDDYRTLKDFLLKGSLPDDWENTKRYRYRKRFEDYVINDEEKNAQYLTGDEFNIFVLINDVPEKLKKNNIDVQLPIKKIVVLPSSKEKIMLDLWRNPAFSGLRSTKSFHSKLQEQFVNITREDVENFLQKLQSKQLVNPTLKAIVKPIVKEDKFQQWEIDLVDYSNVYSHNKGYVFILTVIDCFSKFAYCFPLKNKEGSSIAYCLQKIFYLEGRAPLVISHDQGNEFNNDRVSQLALTWGFENRSSQPYKPQSNGQIERFNGTLKSSITMNFHEKLTSSWIDVLDEIVFNYNNTIHSTTGFKPFEIHRNFSPNVNLNKVVFRRIKDKANNMIKNSSRYNQSVLEPIVVGDTVRVASLALARNRKNILVNKRITKWTKNVYTVIEVKEFDNVNKFKLDTDLGRSYFYRHELQKVNLNSIIKPRKSSSSSSEEEDEEDNENDNGNDNDNNNDNHPDNPHEHNQAEQELLIEPEPHNLANTREIRQLRKSRLIRPPLTPTHQTRSGVRFSDDD